MTQKYDYKEYDSLLDDLDNTHKYKMIYKFINADILSRQEKFIACYRFGLIGGEIISRKELGTRMGLSVERIRNAEYRVLRKLYMWGSLSAYKGR